MTTFDVIGAIKTRRSVRTYDPRRIESRDKSEIADFISSLDNPFGVSGIHIGMIDRDSSADGERLGTYGVIKGASNYLVLGLPDEKPDTVIAGGYEFEKLILYITSLGLGTVWLGGTFRQSNFAKAVNAEERQLLIPAVSPFGHIGEKRMFERLMRKFSHGDSRKPWEQLFFTANRPGEPAQLTPLTATDAGAYAEVLEMVRIAPSATNTQPWRIVKEDGRQVYHLYGQFDTTPGKTTTMRWLDMGIAVCHFEMAAQALGCKARLTRHDPALAVPGNYVYVATFGE